MDKNNSIYYSNELVLIKEEDNFREYQIKNRSGKGKVYEWLLFSGVRVICNDLNLFNCTRKNAENNKVIEISYCVEGSYEYKIDEKTSFVIGPGDVAVNNCGRKNVGVEFPTRRFYGVTVFVDTEVFNKKHERIIKEMEIDTDSISNLAGDDYQPFIFHTDRNIDVVFETFFGGQKEYWKKPLLKTKVIELLVIMSDPHIKRAGNIARYTSSAHVSTATYIQRRITSDPQKHVTIEELSDETGIGTTALKTIFKEVYGVSIYAYFKDWRLHEGQKMLKETDCSIAEIAMKVGYSNPGKFSLSFKNRFGMTPNEFRQIVRLGN